MSYATNVSRKFLFQQKRVFYLVGNTAGWLQADSYDGQFLTVFVNGKKHFTYLSAKFPIASSWRKANSFYVNPR